MEFKEVIGRRRSIRFFDPDRPVEREKIQKMLEAARQASSAVNAQWQRAIVAFRKDLTEDQLNRLKTPVAALNVDLAPVHIHFFNDLSIVNEIKGSRLRELVDVGALAPTHGWSHKFVDEFVYPQILEPWTNSPTYAAGSTFDVGAAATQALLAGVDEGLGVGFVTLNGQVLKEVFGVPDSWLPLPSILVGYPAEDPLGGGQRPRPPFEELYFEGRYGNPFRRDPAVVEELKAAKLIQEPATPNNPERLAEIRRLADEYGLPI